jgi:transcription initiation factor IIE alpha subunit
MKKVILSIAVVALLVATSCKTETKKDKEPVKTEAKKEMAMEVYQCPMDCEKGKTYDEKGNCPVCKMDLKKVKKDAEDHSGHNH